MSELREKMVQNTRRIVIKVGSRLIADMDGISKIDRIESLIAEIAALRKDYEVVLVSSGAIGVGMKLSKTEKRPSDLARLQALAAVGQGKLMSIYESACQKNGFHGAQILLSTDDVSDRRRHLNVCNCIHALLNMDILPIINENDTVSVEEICFGDNDRLAALLGTMIRADLTILLTTVDGLHSKCDAGNLESRIPVVSSIDDEIKAFASGTDGNPYSTGGMLSKLDAAEILMSAGEYAVIADGRDFAVISDILKAKDVGTLFVPVADKLISNKRWLAFFAEPAGDIIIDTGAVKAICEKGKSLLPSGISSFEGELTKGDTVRIINQESKDVVAVGRINYNSSDLSKIVGQHSSKISELLGDKHYDEVIHRNNMVIL